MLFYEPLYNGRLAFLFNGTYEKPYPRKERELNLLGLYLMILTAGTRLRFLFNEILF